MSQSETSVTDARAIFGTSMIGPDDLRRVLGVAAADGGPIPYDAATLRAAHARDEMLVLRVASDAEGPLTMLRLFERFPDLLAPKLREGVGYQLKDEWTLPGEPVAGQLTCRAGWSLVCRTPIPETCNLSYDLQTEALVRHARAIGRPTLARRSGVEAAFDTALFLQAHGTRLLERTWDWTSTPTEDGGFLTVGELDSQGLHVLGYSRAVRFGTLGVCAQH